MLHVSVSILAMYALDLRFNSSAFVYTFVYLIFGLSRGFSFWHSSKMKDNKYSMVDKESRKR